MIKKAVGLTPKWISTAPLHIVCVRIADTHLRHKDSVGGDVLAIVTKRIIAVEVAPGGPYKNSKGFPDLKTNLSINYLFVALGKPLPAVTDFIRSHRHLATSSTDRLLQKYDQILGAQSADRTPAPNHVYDLVRTSIEQLPEPLRNRGHQFLERIQRADVTREISHISSFFESSLTVSQKLMPTTKLGEANVYCWIAYMLYDHIIDEENSAHDLPIANVTMRMAIETYHSLFSPKHPFHDVIHQTFLDMDFANAWEVENTRATIENDDIIISSIPNYDDFSILAKRSFGHALGPMALMHLHQLTKEQINMVENSLRHYLVTRQLNDDLHDWKDDLSKGHLSAVVTQMLKSEHITPGSYKLGDLSSRLQTVFWSRSMEEINNIIHLHINRSLDFIAQSNLFKENSDFLKLITRQREIALGSSKELGRYQSFSSAYNARLKNAS